jgi:methionine-rich copper-binding protein CopC
MRVTRILAAALAAAVIAVLPSAPAWAHNSLTKAVPAKNSTVTKRPGTVALTFLQKVDPEALSITVTDAEKRKVPLDATKAAGKVGSVTFSEPLLNGVYTVTYRVVSTDGHPVQGSYKFTLNDPAAAPPPSARPPATSPAPVATTEAAVPASASSPAQDESRWPVIAAGVAVLLVLGAGVLFVLRRRQTP